jgi:hypothetical protein
MDNSKEKNSLKTLEFKDLDDEVHVFDICGKLLGRIVYYDGNYRYIFWPSNGTSFTVPELEQVIDKIKKISY